MEAYSFKTGDTQLEKTNKTKQKWPRSERAVIILFSNDIIFPWDLYLLGILRMYSCTHLTDRGIQDELFRSLGNWVVSILFRADNYKPI